MKHLKIILKAFNLGNKKINDNDKVENFIWDSVTKINLISIVDEKFSKILDHKKFDKIIYFKDINNLIEKTLKK